MHKLFFTDIILVLLTLLGISYLWFYSNNSHTILIFVGISYILAKIIGFWILPYNKFEIFLNNLIENSKFKKFSGFEIFKTTLVALLFIGFIFVNPMFWFFESILVVMMRVWGIYFIKNLENLTNTRRKNI